MLISLRRQGGSLILCDDPATARREILPGRAWREEWRELAQGEAAELMAGAPNREELAETLRHALAGPGGDGGRINQAAPEELIRLAARLLSHGWAVEGTRPEPPGGIPPGNQPAEAETQTEAVEQGEDSTGVSEDKSKDHWIVVELVGENDEPIPNELCRITTPDGDVVEQETDSKGQVEVQQISVGDCIVEFPELDQDAWEEAPGSGAA